MIVYFFQLPSHRPLSIHPTKHIPRCAEDIKVLHSNHIGQLLKESLKFKAPLNWTQPIKASKPLYGHCSWTEIWRLCSLRSALSFPLSTGTAIILSFTAHARCRPATAHSWSLCLIVNYPLPSPHPPSPAVFITVGCWFSVIISLAAVIIEICVLMNKNGCVCLFSKPSFLEVVIIIKASGLLQLLMRV